MHILYNNKKKFSSVNKNTTWKRLSSLLYWQQCYEIYQCSMSIFFLSSLKEQVSCITQKRNLIKHCLLIDCNCLRFSARELFVIRHLAEDLCVPSSSEAELLVRADNIKSLRDSRTKSVDKIPEVPTSTNPLSSHLAASLFFFFTPVRSYLSNFLLGLSH